MKVFSSIEAKLMFAPSLEMHDTHPQLSLFNNQKNPSSLKQALNSVISRILKGSGNTS
ncbi:hypothetical protein ONS95_000206 [Cadophora gregata]|uniref:uncharacterized protein n=1 Tax=Cadophora gregata TaxID=51156 RepID=UPI0026DD3A86|nr:uncharacterized protein ONS95_000206 [Cadophora gregata]KAK0128228.1 hypothetical protein ONS95_000206 [Cadophora gregata]